MNTATAITVALLAPFWWGMGLLVLALSGDLLPAARPHVARLLEHSHAWARHRRCSGLGRS